MLVCPECRFPGSYCYRHDLECVDESTLPEVTDERFDGVDLEWVEVAPGRMRLVPVGDEHPETYGQHRPTGVYPRGFSAAHGMNLNTWSEYRAASKKLGLVDVGRPPPELKERKKMPTDKRGTVVMETENG